MTYTSLNISGRAEPPQTSRELDLQASLIAALSLLALMLLGRFTVHLPLLPEIMADWLFAVLPLTVVEIGVALLGAFAKRLGFIGCVAVYLIVVTVAGMTCLRWATQSARLAPLTTIVYSLVLWLVIVAGLLPLLGAGWFGRQLWHGALVSTASLFVMHLAYGVILRQIRLTLERRPEVAQTSGRLVNRRTALRAMMTTVIAAAAYDIFKPLYKSLFQPGAGKVAAGTGVFPDLTGLALEITPTDAFYTVSKNAFDPEVNAQRWRLEIGGMVERPVSFTYDDLRRLPAIEEYATLMCIENQVGGELIGNAQWKGVRLRDVLEQAGLQTGVVDIVLRAADGYADSIPVERALAEPTLLVYEMNHAPLTNEHGFPLRLIVPGIFGMKNVKWITQIEAVNYDFKGYWQARGWDDRAEYQTMSRLDVPDDEVKLAPTTIAGVAFAGDRGISQVEVSTDGGATWAPANFKAPLSPYSWVLWHKEWQPNEAGSYTFMVRATDGQGQLQPAEITRPLPSGATGHHRRRIEVERRA